MLTAKVCETLANLSKEAPQCILRTGTAPGAACSRYSMYWLKHTHTHTKTNPKALASQTPQFRSKSKAQKLLRNTGNTNLTPKQFRQETKLTLILSKQASQLSPLHALVYLHNMIMKSQKSYRDQRPWRYAQKVQIDKRTSGRKGRWCFVTDQ